VILSFFPNLILLKEHLVVTLPSPAHRLHIAAMEIGEVLQYIMDAKVIVVA